MTTTEVLKGAALPVAGIIRKVSSLTADRRRAARLLEHLAITGGIVTVVTCALGHDRTMYAAGVLSLLAIWASDSLSAQEGGEA